MTAANVKDDRDLPAEGWQKPKARWPPLPPLAAVAPAGRR